MIALGRTLSDAIVSFLYLAGTNREGGRSAPARPLSRYTEFDGTVGENS